MNIDYTLRREEEVALRNALGAIKAKYATRSLTDPDTIAIMEMGGFPISGAEIEAWASAQAVKGGGA